ncbi:MAG: DUF302 domain-containing protein [Chloroflexi bacterium]|nr:DUF302 domain-containing protein [Chloroflexota bacterium]
MNAPSVLTYHVAAPLPEAEALVRGALQQQGFGILTEVDVAATLRQKLGIETKPYRILGACNPKLAHASLEAEPDVGAFLPCGVALREGASPDQTTVAIQNPQLMAQAFSSPALAALAADALARLTAAMDSVGAAT